MDKLTDLQICERIADIEGYKSQPSSGLDILYFDDEKLQCDLKRHYIPTHDGGEYYIPNPLTDKALCFDLAFKAKIDLIFNDDGSASAYYSKKHCITDSDGKRAICLAYIKKHEVNNG